MVTGIKKSGQIAEAKTIGNCFYVRGVKGREASEDPQVSVCMVVPFINKGNTKEAF